MANQGLFIVLEGSDGSGKGTQFRLLERRLQAVGYEVEVFDFPRYDKESSYFVRRYLNGDYGPASKVSPYTASLFFALDRYEAADDIRSALAAGKVVLANRYVGSNMAHMGSKIEDPIEQRSFFVWEDSLEFQLLNLPRPNLNLFLKVPAEISYELIAQKDRRGYTSKNRDEHESDMEHLKKTVSTYELLCELFPADFVAIDCVADLELLSIAQINNKIWETIQTYLPAQPTQNAHKITLKLSKDVSSPPESSFKTNSKAKSSDASLANKHDIGPVSLELLMQITSLYPDGVSYKSSWSDNKYTYLSPGELPKKAKAKYEHLMQELVALHKKMKARLSEARAELDLVRPTVPMGATFRSTLSLDSKQLEELIRFLSGLESSEALDLANRLARGTNERARQNVKISRTRSQEPEALGNILAKLAQDHLPKNLAAETEAVRLVQAMPRNEFHILADSVYPYSNLPREEIEANLDRWDYQQKYAALKSAVADSRAISSAQIYYKIDVLADRLMLEEILKSGLAVEIKMQPATPRYGYEVPEQLEAYRIEDEYLESFDKSLELFSTLQAAGREDLAIYATLAGHKQRFQLLIKLSPLKGQLSRTPPGNFKDLLIKIVEKISGVHPVVGENLVSIGAAEPAAKVARASTRSHKSHHRGSRGQKSRQ